jgi:hypothetical protein
MRTYRGANTLSRRYETPRGMTRRKPTHWAFPAHSCRSRQKDQTVFAALSVQASKLPWVRILVAPPVVSLQLTLNAYAANYPIQSPRRRERGSTAGRLHDKEDMPQARSIQMIAEAQPALTAQEPILGIDILREHELDGQSAELCACSHADCKLLTRWRGSPARRCGRRSWHR